MKADFMQFIVLGAVIAGVIVLFVSLFPCLRIIRLLPKETLRKQWNFLFGLTVFFIFGYLTYGAKIWHSEFTFINLIVSGILFSGSLFVLVVCLLTLTTIKDIQRIYILERENISDPLMGIFNRRYLERRLKEEISRSNRYNMSLSLLMLDVDRFKNINDTYGHQVGDRVLKKLAQIILELARETDIVARYGGEEIAIVLPNTPISAAAFMAERCRRHVSKKLTVGSDASGGNPVDGITVSIGVSSRRDENTSMDMIIEQADIALYQAKQRGRDQVVVYNPENPESSA